MELRFQGKIFHSKRMSFYIFGNTIYLGKIPEADWVSNICSRFNKIGITISELASPFQKGTLKIYAAESNVILRMFSNLPIK